METTMIYFRSLQLTIVKLVIGLGLSQTAHADLYELGWHTIDSGGGTSSGGSFALAGSIGQPDASTVALSGGGFELSGGFWPGALPAPPACPADVAPQPNGDGIVNVNDLLAVINAWGPCPSPPAQCPADVTNDNLVNVNDLLVVINAWGLCD